MIPEARAQFEALEIDGELLSTGHELIADGGLQVYQERAPVRDAEDDPSDVVSPADLDLLPGSDAWSARFRSRKICGRRWGDGTS